MKWIRRVVLGFLLLVALALGGLWITGNGHILNGIGKTYLVGKTKPDIDDLPYFHTRLIPADHPEPWPEGIIHPGAPDAALLSGMDSMQTTAFLVFWRDTLRYERYSRGYSDTTHSNSFSMAKSFLAIAVGIALDEGYIRSLDQPVTDFIPELRGERAGSLTVRHLLQMASGIPFGESYASPFGYMARAYYGKSLVEETMKYRADSEPGGVWNYEGGNSVLLGMILQRATGRTVSDYFFQKVWSCIGAEHPAYWNLDRAGGMEKTFSGFYATARDFARIGSLYLHEGVWGNDTVVSPGYVRDCTAPNSIPDLSGEPCTWYGLHWWLGSHEGSDYFSCRGMRGQYIVVFPEEELVVVRLGHEQSPERVNHMPGDLAIYLDAAFEVMNASAAHE